MNAIAIADVLRREIVTGLIRPGAELPQQRLAERFNVSRIPVRDALALLAADGIVVAEPNRGAHVLTLSSVDIDEIYSLRILLECDCLTMAISKATPEDLEEARRALLRSDIDALTDKWADSDWQFHETLYRPAKRMRQIDMIRHLRQLCRVHLVSYDHMKYGTDQWLLDHAEIVEAYCSGEASVAATALANHLRQARDFLTEAMST